MSKQRTLICAVGLAMLSMLGCKAGVEKTSKPGQDPSIPTDTNVVLKVGVTKDGMLKQQTVHAYKTQKLAERKLAVRAGASLTILESVDGASRVHFATDAYTSDYKSSIKQSEAIGWIATDEIVHIWRAQQ